MFIFTCYILTCFWALVCCKNNPKNVSFVEHSTCTCARWVADTCVLRWGTCSIWEGHLVCEIGEGGGVYNREMFLLAQWVVDCVPHKNAIYSTLLSTTTAPAPECLQTEHIISFAVTKKQNIPAIFLYRFYKKWTDEKDRGDGKALASHGNKQELVHMCETSCIHVKSDLFPPLLFRRT